MRLNGLAITAAITLFRITHVEAQIISVSEDTIDDWVNDFAGTLAAIDTTLQQTFLGWRSDHRFGNPDRRLDFEKEHELIDRDLEEDEADVDNNGNWRRDFIALVPNLPTEEFQPFTEKSEVLDTAINKVIDKIESADYTSLQFQPEAQRQKDGFFNWRLVNKEAKKETLKYLKELKGLNEDWADEFVLMNGRFYEEDGERRLAGEQDSVDFYTLVEELDRFLLFMGELIWYPGVPEYLLQYVLATDYLENPDQDEQARINIASSEPLINGVRVLAGGLRTYVSEMVVALRDGIKLLSPKVGPPEPLIQELIAQVKNVTDSWGWYADKLMLLAADMERLVTQVKDALPQGVGQEFVDNEAQFGLMGGYSDLWQK
ncbi:hypothetical protein ABW20_dc0109108 [Dactylellina cionopaga]|nr:hypothetical protein ABW20_dc0109108 [Dactylellina cionopaga]